MNGAVNGQDAAPTLQPYRINDEPRSFVRESVADWIWKYGLQPNSEDECDFAAEDKIDDIMIHEMECQDDTQNCSICLRDMEPGEMVKTLDCAHIYHASCINAWLRINMKCPLCRVEM